VEKEKSDPISSTNHDFVRRGAGERSGNSRQKVSSRHTASSGITEKVALLASAAGEITMLLHTKEGAKRNLQIKRQLHQGNRLTAKKKDD